MTKRVLVKTDDPRKRKMTVVVTGRVEALVTIEPPALTFEGKPGETLEKFVTITPSAKHSFSILGMTQNKDSGVLAELVEPEKKGDPWRIKVNVHSKTEASLIDTLTLKTSSPHRPELKIRVFAIFMKQG